MKIAVKDGESDKDFDITVISFINGVIIGVDENLTEDEELDNYERIEQRKLEKSAVESKKRSRKNPEDNLGDVVATLDTGEIERGVDFEDIIKSIDNEEIEYGDFFENDEILAKYCEHYDYNLPDFIRLFIEHRPEIMTVEFMKKHIRPMVSALLKKKEDFENEVEGCQYRRIFAHL